MFIQPCFIRKNTSELKKKLEELGYKYLNVGTGLPHLCTDNDILTDKGFGIFRECNMGNLTLLYESKIDCGTNEDLFLAIASLRNDSDKFQYITNGDVVLLCEMDSMNEFLKILYDGINLNDIDITNRINKWHKLTVEELIKHFK